MKVAALFATLLAFGWTPAEAKTCTELFAPNDYLSPNCKVAGTTISTSEFVKVCAPSCVQGLKSYTLALKSACAAAGAAAAERVEAGCAGASKVQPQILTNANADQCLDYFTPNDFLNANCKVSGKRIANSDFAHVCSSQCAQDLKSYNLALRSTCGASGDAEAKRIEAGCASGIKANVVEATKCTDSFGPNDFLRARCQVQDGDIDTADEYAKVCQGVCRQDLNGYLYALRSACANDGDAEARRIENACHAGAVNSMAMLNTGNSCISYYNANDFLKSGCQIADGKVSSNADFAKVCSAQCKQDLSGYLSALRATCAAEGDFEATRIENGCKAGKGLGL